jgi:hypothetical protein
MKLHPLANQPYLDPDAGSNTAAIRQKACLNRKGTNFLNKVSADNLQLNTWAIARHRVPRKG